jgi:hypothetical protein
VRVSFSVCSHPRRKELAEWTGNTFLLAKHRDPEAAGSS